MLTISSPASFPPLGIRALFFFAVDWSFKVLNNGMRRCYDIWPLCRCLIRGILLNSPMCVFCYWSGRDFIAPCKCKGTSKYVHRECLDHWRSVKVWMLSELCTSVNLTLTCGCCNVLANILNCKSHLNMVIVKYYISGFSNHLYPSSIN